MKRKEEIVIVLKSLLSKAYSVVDTKRFSDETYLVINGAKELREISKEIGIYLDEIDKL